MAQYSELSHFFYSKNIYKTWCKLGYIFGCIFRFCDRKRNPLAKCGAFCLQERALVPAKCKRAIKRASREGLGARQNVKGRFNGHQERALMPVKCKKAIKRASREGLGARKMQKGGLMGIKKGL
jgi:hypothetical protein